MDGGPKSDVKRQNDIRWRRVGTIFSSHDGSASEEGWCATAAASDMNLLEVLSVSKPFNMEKMRICTTIIKSSVETTPG